MKLEIEKNLLIAYSESPSENHVLLELVDRESGKSRNVTIPIPPEITSTREILCPTCKLTFKGSRSFLCHRAKVHHQPLTKEEYAERQKEAKARWQIKNKRNRKRSYHRTFLTDEQKASILHDYYDRTANKLMVGEIARKYGIKEHVIYHLVEMDRKVRREFTTLQEKVEATGSANPRVHEYRHLEVKQG